MEFYAHTSLVCIGTNPELANFDNPDGAMYGWQSFVVSEAADGTRTRLAVKYSLVEIEALQPAVRLAEALDARFKNFGKLPVRFNEWSSSRPVYGSEAYIRYGSAADLEREYNDEMT